MVRSDATLAVIENVASDELASYGLQVLICLHDPARGHEEKLRRSFRDHLTIDQSTYPNLRK